MRRLRRVGQKSWHLVQGDRSCRAVSITSDGVAAAPSSAFSGSDPLHPSTATTPPLRLPLTSLLRLTPHHDRKQPPHAVQRPEHDAHRVQAPPSAGREHRMAKSEHYNHVAKLCPSVVLAPRRRPAHDGTTASNSVADVRSVPANRLTTPVTACSDAAAIQLASAPQLRTEAPADTDTVVVFVGGGGRVNVSECVRVTTSVCVRVHHCAKPTATRTASAAGPHRRVRICRYRLAAARAVTPRHSVRLLL